MPQPWYGAGRRLFSVHRGKLQSQVNALLLDGITAYEAVRIALLNNKAFQSQFQDIGVSRSELVKSALFTNPSLSFSARALEGGGRANLSFGLAQELVDLWQIPVRKRIAKDKLESTVLAVASEKPTVIVIRK